MTWRDSLDIPDALVARYLGSEGLEELASETLSEAAVYLKYGLDVELALLQVLCERGAFSAELMAASREAAGRVELSRFREEESKTRHDLKALVNVFAEQCPAEVRPFIHLGATSYDILANAHLMRLREGCRAVVIPKLRGVAQQLLRLSVTYAGTPQIGRTHGQYAEPMTFGYAMAVYLERLGQCLVELERSLDLLRGKFSGAVGAYITPGLLYEDPRQVEIDVLQKVGLLPSQTATQICHPEPALNVLHHLNSAFGVLANLADDMRNLQRSEINEVAESYLAATQVGSSAMPHKRNPITWENVKSLWKVCMPQMMTFYMDQISEHQRDLSNSASARFQPRLLLGLAVAASRAEKALAKLVVDPESMGTRVAELEEVISGPLQALLSQQGVPDAHEIVRKLSIQARESKVSLWELTCTQSELAPHLERFTPTQRLCMEQPGNLIKPAEEATLRCVAHWSEVLGLTV
jgi:adenylosuccinate lyase